MTEPPPLPPRALLRTAGCLYVVLLAAALLWLGLRGRLDHIAAVSIGDHGPVLAATAGLLAGLLATGALRLASFAVPPVQACERRLAAMVGPLDDGAVLALALLSALAEEFFFRLAVQDALGVPAAVAAYVVTNTGPGFWAWAPVALGCGLLFSGLVAAGCGLLAATTAHAVLNWLALRRILDT